MQRPKVRLRGILVATAVLAALVLLAALALLTPAGLGSAGSGAPMTVHDLARQVIDRAILTFHPGVKKAREQARRAAEARAVAEFRRREREKQYGAYLP